MVAAREGSERRGFVFTALGDVREVHLGGEAVYQGAVLSGNDGDQQPGLTGQRDTHHVGEGQTFPLGVIGAPVKAAVSQDAIEI